MLYRVCTNAIDKTRLRTLEYHCGTTWYNMIQAKDAKCSITAHRITKSE